MLWMVGVASAMHSAATDHGKLMTLVAGKRRSLLMAGDDDDAYDKNHQRYAEDNGAAFNSLYAVINLKPKGVFIATQLNSAQLTQLNSVQPSQSYFCLWRHDLQTESTGSLRSLIGDSYSRCERVDNSTSSWVDLCRYKRALSNNNKRLRSRYYTVEANYWRTQSIAQPVCNSRATCCMIEHTCVDLVQLHTVKVYYTG